MKTNSVFTFLLFFLFLFSCNNNIERNSFELDPTAEKKIDRELYNAMIKIKKDQVGPSKQFNSFGCSIKWK